MTRHLRNLALLAAMALGLAFAQPSPAAAQAGSTPAPATVSSCAGYPGLTSRIALCVREALNGVSSAYFEQFYKKVQLIITGFITLVVIIYGILAAFGMLEKPSRDIFALVVKLTFVVFFVANVNEMHTRLIKLMDAAAATVVEATPSTGDVLENVPANRVECMKRMHEAAAFANNGQGYVAPWLAMDCMLDSVIGISIPVSANGGNLSASAKQMQDMAKNRKIDASTKGMSRGLIYFFFSTMQSSILGLLMAIVGFIFLYTTVWLIGKALFVYLAGYIGITFMMIFAPIFLPLVLLRATKEYFNKWVKLTISFALQPIIILVFISLSITAIDLAVFSGDYSVMYRIAGDDSRKATFNINQYLEEKKIVLEKPAVLAGIRTDSKVAELEKSNNTDFIKGFRNNKKCLDAMMKGDESATTKAECESYYPLQWWRKSIDWKKMAEVRIPEVKDPGAETNDPKAWTKEDRKGRAMAREVFASVLFMAMVVAIMNGLLNIVPMVANDLVGESFQSPNLAGSIGQKGGMAGNISSMVSQQIRSMSGGRR